MNNITPDTSLALLQAAQNGNDKAVQQVKNVRDLDLKKIEGAAQEFESVFIAEMMKPMFEGISTEAPFGGGKGEEVFRGLLVQEYGKLISQTGNIGLADQVRDEMIRMQENIDNESP